MIFIPGRVSFEALLAAFWQIHDLTQIGHQGFDIGEQYRTAVFTHSAEQMELALASRVRKQQLRRRPTTTEVVPAGPSYPAEPYHQRLYERDDTGALGGTCALSDLKGWLVLAGPEDPSHRNGVTHESGDPQRQ